MGAMLTQGVAGLGALRGDDAAVVLRESAVGVDTLQWFLSKMTVNLLEIFPAALTWGGLTWYLSGDNVEVGELASIAFAMMYAHWGLAYVLGAAFPEGTVQTILSVVFSFCFMLCIGLAPSLHTLMHEGKNGQTGSSPVLNMFTLLSAPRWTAGYWWRLHFSSDAFKAENLAKANGKPPWDDTDGFGPIRFSKSCRPGPLITRWEKGNGSVCSLEPLLLLGLMWRGIAASLLLLKVNKYANGGTMVVAGKVRLGKLGTTMISSLGLALSVFLFVFTQYLTLYIG